MSYDLYFYKKKGNSLTEQTVSDYLNKTIQFNDSDYARQWSYENPETGVYFMIDWNEPNTDKEDIEIWDEFEEFENLNFSVTINFWRPRYFGLEIFPIIEKIIKELDLHVLNPQEGDEIEIPKKFNNDYLQNQWIANNDKLSADYFNEMNFKYMHPLKSDAMWWFQLHRKEIEDSLTEDIFVPNFFILNSKEDDQLYTACVWPNHIPIVLPKVDYLIIKKEYKRLFKHVVEDGLVSYETVIQELGDYFEDFGYNSIPELKVLRQDNANKMKNKFNNLRIYKSVNEFGGGVSRDGFVNARP
jgi:hypothetical protein